MQTLQKRRDVLALRGGSPVRPEPLPPWPPALDPATASELQAWIADGARTDRHHTRKQAFEAAFAAFCGVRHAIAVNSGTTALDLAVEALGLSSDATILAADYGHPATIRYAATHHQLRLLDVAPGSLCLDPAAVEAALEEGGVGCVITTHFAGQPAGAARLASICGRHGVPLIEDAAHAHGALCRGVRAGAFGRLGCFSLHDTKTLPAGEGGVVVTNDDDLAARIWRLHDIGRDPRGEAYAFAALGGNFRISAFAAALAHLRLARLEADADQRQTAADNVRRLLPADAPLALLPQAADVERHGYHFLPARYLPGQAQGLSRTRFVLALNAEGVPCTLGWPHPLRRIPGLSVRAEETPHTETAVGESVWLDQRLLLDRDGPEQIVAAVLKVQCLAGSLRRVA
jgi:dTDP-4-amino-4,6-dideoxygalactose transaminase